MTALDDLRAVYEQFKAMPPLVVAVWCIDRPDALGRMRALCQGTAPVGSIIGGVPVYEWYSRYASDEDWATRPECFKEPGVYMQFNNGQYVGVLT